MTTKMADFRPFIVTGKPKEKIKSDVLKECFNFCLSQATRTYSFPGQYTTVTMKDFSGKPKDIETNENIFSPYKTKEKLIYFNPTKKKFHIK